MTAWRRSLLLPRSVPKLKDDFSSLDEGTHSCYTFTESGKTWTENRNTCKGDGGDLVSMETEEEWQFINDEIQHRSIAYLNEYHIGLEKNGGDWTWINGGPLTISKWQVTHGEPSGDGDVAVMSKDYPPGTQGLFNDLPDYFKRAFICEMPRGT
ncbi:C-type lectin domain 4 member E [Desmophyllum pertusum]|uniref:C-type lectin domain 4 member E n=1 Tax=Desmophyllum pertusum TaxID=174260 RepID=A0A9X0A3Q1_9CNID|nr:C-type lectin domain 4 member E [Desmophyllum pertusum]